jgi:hypothetical protein
LRVGHNFHQMQPKQFSYYNLGYWFLLLIVLALAGFYHTYFVNLPDIKPAFVHVHFLLMGLWILMLIAQPFLIKFKKVAAHRFLGKVSYVLVPLVLWSAWFLARRDYYGKIQKFSEAASAGLNNLSEFEILKAASVHPATLIGVILFALFYSLAIRHRKQSARHARYMLATVLILLWPTVDRIFFINLQMKSIFGISSYFVSMLIIDLILVLLLCIDFKNKTEIRTLSYCLLIFITSQFAFYILPTFDWWAVVVKVVMLPKS